MNWKDYIDSEPGVLSGKPILKGTRISVEFIMQLFLNGWTKKEILDNYPQLTQDMIDAALSFILDMVKDESLFFLNKDVA